MNDPTYNKICKEFTTNPTPAPHTHRRLTPPAKRREITPRLAHVMFIFIQLNEQLCVKEVAEWTGMAERTAAKQLEVLYEKKILEVLDLKPHFYRLEANPDAHDPDFYHHLMEAVEIYRKRLKF